MNVWTSKLLPGERYNWSDNEGHMYLPKEQFKLPDNQWEWETIWFIDKNPEFTDESGWQYSSDFSN